MPRRHRPEFFCAARFFFSGVASLVAASHIPQLSPCLLPLAFLPLGMGFPWFPAGSPMGGF